MAQHTYITLDKLIRFLNRLKTTFIQKISTGSTNGSISVDGVDIKVKGLDTAAYTKSTDYATAAQGSKADSAVQSVNTGSANGTISVDGSDVAVKGLGSNAYTSYTNKSATSGGTDVSLVTTGEKYEWNNMIPLNQKGAANGVTPLNNSGKIDSTYLPSYVDDVLEYPSSSEFPTTGEAGKIYVDTTSNLPYRWSGTTYVAISSSIALGETSSTAYRGDRGKTAYDHATDSSRLTTAQSSGLYKIATTAQGHVASVTAVTKSDITGLGIPAQDTTYSDATTSAHGLMSTSDKSKLDSIDDYLSWYTYTS